MEQEEQGIRVVRPEPEIANGAGGAGGARGLGKFERIVRSHMEQVEQGD